MYPHRHHHPTEAYRGDALCNFPQLAPWVPPPLWMAVHCWDCYNVGILSRVWNLFPRVETGKVIRQEKKQKRKEGDKVWTIHSDFVIVEQANSACLEKKGKGGKNLHCPHIGFCFVCLFFFEYKIKALDSTWSLKAAIRDWFKRTELTVTPLIKPKRANCTVSPNCLQSIICFMCASLVNKNTKDMHMKEISFHPQKSIDSFFWRLMYSYFLWK